MKRARDRRPSWDPTAADWFAFLPEAEQTTCRREFASLAAYGQRPGDQEYDDAWRSWRATAEVYSEPQLAEYLRQHFAGDGDTLSRPDLIEFGSRMTEARP